MQFFSSERLQKNEVNSCEQWNADKTDSLRRKTLIKTDFLFVVFKIRFYQWLYFCKSVLSAFISQRVKLSIKIIKKNV
ncbi:hypothetical protein B8T70_08950 [Flavobacterium sp. AJR]|nr:hypothetical protein B8T70_08950 [Flavobacterium sp. AJR]